MGHLTTFTEKMLHDLYRCNSGIFEVGIEYFPYFSVSILDPIYQQQQKLTLIH